MAERPEGCRTNQKPDCLFPLKNRPGTVHLTQDELLEKTVEIDLEKAKVAARADRRPVMVGELRLGEIILCRDCESCLVERIQPRLRVSVRDSESAIRKRLVVLLQLLEIRFHHFGGALEMLPQFRLDIKFPLSSQLFFRGAG